MRWHPTHYPWLATITLIGGTVGGYITFSGGHRLIDAGITGQEHLKDVRRAAFMGMSVDAVVRILLFLAVLGVVSMGYVLDPKDPAGSAFLLGAGEIGHKLFGIVFFCAALTSVVGAAYTSVSFLKTLFKVVERYEKLTIHGIHFRVHMHSYLYRQTGYTINRSGLCEWFDLACYLSRYAIGNRVRRIFVGDL